MTSPKSPKVPIPHLDLNDLSQKKLGHLKADKFGIFGSLERETKIDQFILEVQNTKKRDPNFKFQDSDFPATGMIISTDP
jgi:hypothetical protein